ncbi:hypothetical protein RFI_09151 [Reticulomyxa filosa]|uniref:PDZ domain-containing protein n=1 Tax=Reticulomyxa filosa TaxID=46433 RepID=X6NQL4_RETFI|nr:hypothetical protein RFI_09151 [Reticulomyxa filosa]|eukprot:ETO27984.1 hypothetical protein RFI_09151 [Reticulomyxa filosa]
MEWTETEDGKNLWVSSVLPKSESARKGVVPGSLLIALNGIDIKDLGAPSIHDKASSCGLPLRITFQKPDGINAPSQPKVYLCEKYSSPLLLPSHVHVFVEHNTQDMKVDPNVVNKCIKLLKDPTSWELSDKQREEMCKKQGANPAEVASAIFLAKHMIENANAKPQYETMTSSYDNVVTTQYPGPSNSDFPPPPAYTEPMDGNMTYAPGAADYGTMNPNESPPATTELDLPDPKPSLFFFLSFMCSFGWFVFFWLIHLIHCLFVVLSLINQKEIPAVIWTTLKLGLPISKRAYKN